MRELNIKGVVCVWPMRHRGLPHRRKGAGHPSGPVGPLMVQNADLKRGALAQGFASTGPQQPVSTSHKATLGHVRVSGQLWAHLLQATGPLLVHPFFRALVHCWSSFGPFLGRVTGPAWSLWIAFLGNRGESRARLKIAAKSKIVASQLGGEPLFGLCQKIERQKRVQKFGRVKK